MSTSTAGPAEATADYLDQRTGIAGAVKEFARKVFPDHWSFLLGEIALYSFVVLHHLGILPDDVLRAEHGPDHLRR